VVIHRYIHGLVNVNRDYPWNIHELIKMICGYPWGYPRLFVASHGDIHEQI